MLSPRGGTVVNHTIFIFIVFLWSQHWNLNIAEEMIFSLYRHYRSKLTPQEAMRAKCQRCMFCPLRAGDTLSVSRLVFIAPLACSTVYHWQLPGDYRVFLMLYSTVTCKHQSRSHPLTESELLIAATIIPTLHISHKTWIFNIYSSS